MKRSWKEHLVSAMEIPGDLAYKDAIVTLTGPRQVTVENYRSILSYTGEELVILTQGGRVRVRGSGLTILWYTPAEMEIRGRIQEILLENGKG
ncbi:MAG: YabP/YqfC family sporulation protein [Eubacteriales bacterium]|nr:YabP/YqfC family sporulation protein [Eubacteriales bacterium]